MQAILGGENTRRRSEMQGWLESGRCLCNLRRRLLECPENAEEWLHASEPNVASAWQLCTAPYP